MIPGPRPSDGQFRLLAGSGNAVDPPVTAPPAAKSALLPVDDALARVLDGVRPLGPEHVPLTEAAGRTLAHDLAAALTNPPFDVSSMDGYAVRAADLKAAPVTLKLAGESAAGWP